MAVAKTPRRRKPAESVRERSVKTAKKPEGKRRIRKTAGAVSRPFAIAGRFIKKILRPFRFLLWPFKTRLVRFIGRVLAAILFFRYFRESWQELKQVTWPNRRQTIQLTIAVFIFATVFGLIITITDYGLGKIFEKILLQ